MAKQSKTSPLIRKGKYQENFTVLPNTTLQSKEITPEALGVLCNICSRPSTWVVHKSVLVKQLKGCGRDKLDRIFKELQELGYLVSYRNRDEKGRITGVEWHFFPTPQPDLIKEEATTLETRIVDEATTLETHNTGNPRPGKPATIKERSLENTDHIKTTTTARARELFDFNLFDRCNVDDPMTERAEKLASNVFFNHTDSKHYSKNPVGDFYNSFDAFIDYNVRRGTEPVSLEQFTNLYTKWVQLSKPTKKTKESPKPAPLKPRKERTQAVPAEQSEDDFLTHAEKLWLKQGNVPVNLRQRAGSDEKYQEILKEYGLEA